MSDAEVHKRTPNERDDNDRAAKLNAIREKFALSSRVQNSAAASLRGEGKRKEKKKKRKSLNNVVNKNIPVA
jgi:hypothetical protein